RDLALEHADILAEQLEDAALTLAPVYQLVVWSRQNDHISLDRRLEGAMLERARAHAQAEAETERWRAEREAARERSAEGARARRDAGALQRSSAPDGKRTPPLATLFKPKSAARAAPSHEPSPARQAARGESAADSGPQRIASRQVEPSTG